jgi:dihydroneopterin aldolase
VEGSSYQTVEALATFVARILTMEFEVHKCSVGVEKPSALASVEGAGVEITRTRAFFSESTFWGTDDGDLST